MRFIPLTFSSVMVDDATNSPETCFGDSAGRFENRLSELRLITLKYDRRMPEATVYGRRAKIWSLLAGHEFICGLRMANAGFSFASNACATSSALSHQNSPKRAALISRYVWMTAIL